MHKRAFGAKFKKADKLVVCVSRGTDKPVVTVGAIPGVAFKDG